ncbi:MAG: aminopeptidase P family protein [Corallococcus sp.]|nr:aminopeptidase P family protein [Corallococcus sp.]MCM1359718.1 aminopeptidase P family protein [Corallococcus sp.]MCM1395427.1 aminopeptidase P family protein [Corallococcus sp.]
MKDVKKLFDLTKTDAILVVSEKNRMYFTEFASTFGYLLLFPDNRNVFITDPRYYEMACALNCENLRVTEAKGGAGAIEAVADLLRDKRCKTVGFEDTELTVAEFSVLGAHFKDFTLTPCGNHINLVRSVKDETEIAYIKKAQSITDAAFSDILKIIRVGMSEKELAVELEYRLDKNGAEGLAFDTIIASGVNTSKPHAHPTDKKIENGDAVTMDFGARYHGYCSDMTRTVFVGEPSAEMRKIYETVLAAQKSGIQNAYVGASGEELDSFCREVITAHGFGQYFTHSTGHSLGIDIHEEPRAAVGIKTKFAPKQFVTCEPGVYVPGLGGVRIEDLLLFEQDGVIDLTNSDKGIIIL